MMLRAFCEFPAGLAAVSLRLHVGAQLVQIANDPHEAAFVGGTETTHPRTGNSHPIATNQARPRFTSACVNAPTFPARIASSTASDTGQKQRVSGAIEQTMAGSRSP